MNKQPSILLMDEDTKVLEQLQTVLQREGYQVLVAVDGYAALRLAMTAQPDLIVSDLLLAGLDGYEVWKKLRGDKQTAKIPILVVSALTIPASNKTWRPTPEAEWQILQYETTLPKPIDLPRFVRVVEKLLHPENANSIPGGPSVIVVTEDAEIQSHLATLLRQYDFGVRTPESLVKALHLIKSIPPALLIVDYHRPNGAMRDIIWQANDFAPNTVKMVIIDPAQEIEAELHTYCDGYLTLPFHPLYTLTNLNHILETHSMRRRIEALSTNLLTTNQSLLSIQDNLQAQNEELQLLARQPNNSDQRGNFMGMVVHDLKSPLGSILGTLNFIATDPELEIPPISQNLLSGSVAAGNQMLRLIETMLEGQRLESGEFEVYTEPFDLATIIDIALEQIRPFLTLHTLQLECAIAADLPLAFADANVTQRISENLLDNAFKYSPANAVITLTAKLDGNFITVSITDDGPSIPKMQQSYIFDRMALLEKVGHTAARPGFGLGLSFCNLATTAIGGSIWVESEGERGATFSFTIPLFE
jgi:signal transduction histidine kinase